jgi:hypothetical protein
MNSSSPPTSPILQSLTRHANTGDSGIKGSFHAEGQLALDALSVTVQNIGRLVHPVALDTAKKLHEVSTAARHGRREKTLTDTKVRDTGEVGRELLTLEWATDVLPALTTEVTQALGLSHLDIRLHNLLIYGAGQFFKPHQDTEKHPGMVATLVVVLPSPHIGGELRLWHDSKRVQFTSQNLQAHSIRWCAFYADCRHEVLPVTEGWRVVLTFDLVLSSASTRPRTPASPPLVAALRKHFFPQGDPHLRPWVFLLDHEYTERGLRWSLLKGEDRPRVEALRAAAEELGLTLHLALTEIHELWTATVQGRGDEPEPDELIEENLVLDFWVNAEDQQLNRGVLGISFSDTASFTVTDQAFLVNEEYEGYMGNYGETLDYWYRRAALVIENPLTAEVSRFVADFDAALADAVGLARCGHHSELTQRLRAAAQSLETQRRVRGRDLFEPYVELAIALPDSLQAHDICQGFQWFDFKPKDASILARLAKRWGEEWTLTLIKAWTDHATTWRNIGEYSSMKSLIEPPWPTQLSEFIGACRRAGLNDTVIDNLLDRCIAALLRADKVILAQIPAWRQATLPQRMHSVCDLAAALQYASLPILQLSALSNHLQGHSKLYPLCSLRPLIQSLPSNFASQPQGIVFISSVAQTLQKLLALPEPNTDDHSINAIEWTCHCADCSQVIHWAESPSPQMLLLPLVEIRRKHVQSHLQNAAVPVSIETIKKGSPYKLAIRKPPDLHAMRQKLRQAWAEDLAAIGKLVPIATN